MEQVLQFISEQPPLWGLLLVFAAAAAEYLLPPLPADSVVLAGSLLVVAGSASFTTVYLVALLGGTLGALLQYGLGYRLLATHSGQEDTWLRRGCDKLFGPKALDKFMQTYRRYGIWVLVFNRALIAVRAATFFAAGAARLSLAPTMTAGLVSNAAWTALVLGLGVSVGGNWQQIEATFASYQRAVYLGGAVLAGAFVLFKLWRIRRNR